MWAAAKSCRNENKHISLESVWRLGRIHAILSNYPRSKPCFKCDLLFVSAAIMKWTLFRMLLRFFTMQDSRVVSVFRVRALCSSKGNARESLFSLPSKLDYFPSSPGAGACNETAECAISLGSITLALSPFAEAPHSSSKTKNNA